MAESNARLLEPRVAKVETQIESISTSLNALTGDVRSLAGIVREHAENVESQIRSLTVAVTTASGPRKMEWSVVMTAIFLVMAIGTAALSPMYLRLDDTRAEAKRIDSAIHAHESLPMHQVGQARMDALTERVRRVEDDGSGITRERLAIIESWIEEQKSRTKGP